MFGNFNSEHNGIQTPGTERAINHNVQQRLRFMIIHMTASLTGTVFLAFFKCLFSLTAYLTDLTTTTVSLQSTELQSHQSQ